MTPEQLNAWRVIPRILITLYGIQVWRVGEWFMSLSSPSPEQAAFVATVFGASAAWFGLYVNSGGNHGRP